MSAGTDPETQFWNEVKSNGAREYYEAYLKQYPKGKYLALGKLELKKLDDKDKADKARKDAEQLKAQRDDAEREQQEAVRREQEAKDAAEMRPGKVFKDCANCPEMVMIPAGSFQMGSNDYDSERPVHRVALKGFALGKTEVTQRQWRDVMGNNPSHFSGCGDDCPVEMVSWDDAKIFIQRLNAKTGKIYRLPSEVEWEYACRSGGSHTYCGSSNLDSVARWYASKTYGVAGKQANAWGLYDMSGNVWEWVEDCWNDNYNGAPTDGSAWTRGNCGQRLVRGASWNYVGPQYARAAIRIRIHTSSRFNDIGFRLARTFP